MKANYKNWGPKGMIYGRGAATADLAGAAIGMKHLTDNTLSTVGSAVLSAGAESRVMMLYGSTLLVGKK